MNDWPAIIRELRRTMRAVDIAIACERTEKWVCNLQSGRIKEPTYTPGEILKNLQAAAAAGTIVTHDC